MGFAIAAATTLRTAGVRTQLYSEQKKFKAKMAYADKIQVPYVALVGEDEMREGVLSVKDMQSGEQQKLSRADAAAFIREQVDQRNSGAVINGLTCIMVNHIILFLIRSETLIFDIMLV